MVTSFVHAEAGDRRENPQTHITLEALCAVLLRPMPRQPAARTELHLARAAAEFTDVLGRQPLRVVLADVVHQVRVVWKPTVALATLKARHRVMHAPVHGQRLRRAEPLAADVTEMDTAEVTRLDVVAQQARRTAGKNTRTVLADQRLAVDQRRWLGRMLLAKVIDETEPTGTRCTAHFTLLLVVVLQVVVVNHVGRLTRLTTQLTRPVTMLRLAVPSQLSHC